MRTKIDRWGNSLGLRLPKALAEEVGLHEGDSVEINVSKGALEVRKARPKYTLDELLVGGPFEDAIDRDFAVAEPVGKERFWEDEDE